MRLNRYWLSLICVVAVVAGFTGGFALAIHMNPDTADRYLLNLGSLGDWVSGIGALLAVVVTLWLAHRQGLEDTESLKVSAEMIMTPGYGAPIISLQLSAVSNGKRPATLTAFVFSSDHSENFLAITGFANVSQAFPMTLQYGQKGTAWIAIEQLVGILNYIEKECAGQFDGLHVYANTTLGNFQGVINQNVINALQGLQSTRAA